MQPHPQLEEASLRATNGVLDGKPSARRDTYRPDASTKGARARKGLKTFLTDGLSQRSTRIPAIPAAAIGRITTAAIQVGFDVGEGDARLNAKLMVGSWWL